MNKNIHNANGKGFASVALEPGAFVDYKGFARGQKGENAPIHLTVNQTSLK